VRRWPAIVGWRWLGAMRMSAVVLIMVAKQRTGLFGVLLHFLLPDEHKMRQRARRAVQMARRQAAIDARTLLEVDPRPPILLLRSFADDEVGVTTESVHDDKTFEEVIAHEMNSWGPVVAIGRPGEHVPVAGAAREYVSDHEWQQRVEDLSRLSQAILMLGGSTAGLVWELQRLRHKELFHQVLLLFPPAEPMEAERRLLDMAKRLEGSDLSRLVVLNLWPESILAWVGNDSVIVLDSTGKTEADYRTALKIGMRLVSRATAQRPSAIRRESQREPGGHRRLPPSSAQDSPEQAFS
jgi:hypothetical protein